MGQNWNNDISWCKKSNQIGVPSFRRFGFFTPKNWVGFDVFGCCCFVVFLLGSLEKTRGIPRWIFGNRWWRGDPGHCVLGSTWPSYRFGCVSLVEIFRVTRRSSVSPFFLGGVVAVPTFETWALLWFFFGGNEMNLAKPWMMVGFLF